MVNGVPVKFTGACRHEEFSPYGHALTEECWKTDIALLKAANINAVRTSHYNHAARFLELCDEAGLYVLDEVPFCWVANEVRDASRTWAYIFRSKETLARDKNRPSVVVWSCGNESGYGPNAQAVFDYMKGHDPTRLALISQQGLDKNAATDFDDYHYPPVPQIKAMIGSPDSRQSPRHLYRDRRHRRPLGQDPGRQLGPHLALRRHRRRLHLGMAGTEPGRPVSGAVEHPQPRRAGHRPHHRHTHVGRRRSRHRRSPDQTQSLLEPEDGL